MGAINLNTGDFRYVDLDTAVLGPDEVLVSGTPDQIERVAGDVRRNVDPNRKQRRKAQRAARKKNR